MGKLNISKSDAFGDEVKNLHRKLAKHGFEIPSSEIDRGFFGPGTRNAVAQWQRNHGLPVTGTVDERTNASLDAAPDSSPVQPPKTGPSPGMGATVRSGSPSPQASAPIVPPRSAVPGVVRQIFSAARLPTCLLRLAPRQANGRRER